jgi:hypothetical protein
VKIDNVERAHANAVELFHQQADLERSAQRLADAFASQQTDVAELFEETLEGLTHRLTAAQRREGR